MAWLSPYRELAFAFSREDLNHLKRSICRPSIVATVWGIESFGRNWGLVSYFSCVHLYHMFKPMRFAEET